MKRIIYIGADSAGYEMKEALIQYLEGFGYEVKDMGTDSSESCHYPIFAAAVCHGVLENLDGAYGILVCGTGIGMSMCANKYKGIRAAVVSEVYSATMTRAHNDANVLCLGARVIDLERAKELVHTFLNTDFDGGRHALRVGLIGDIEEGRL